MVIWDPIWAKKKKKRRPIWAVCTKSGQNCSRIGPKKFNHAGRTGEHKQRELPSRRQSLRVATGSLEENVLSLLQYWLSSRVNKVLMLCRYRAAMSQKMWNKIFNGISQKLLPTKAEPIASLNLSIIHWSLSKFMTMEQISMFRIESCAKEQN